MDLDVVGSNPITRPNQFNSLICTQDCGPLLLRPLCSVLGSIRPSTTKAFSRTKVVFNDNQGPKIEVRSTRPWPVITGLGSFEYGGPHAEEEREERDFVRAALALGRLTPVSYRPLRGA